MPRLIDRSERTDDIVSAVACLVLAGGIQHLSLRKIAREVGISLGSLTSHYETRERLLRVVCARFLQRVLEDLAVRRTEGLGAFLLSEGDDLIWTRMWLAAAELARADEGIAHWCARADEDERALIVRVIVRPDPADPAADLLLALVHGLRHAITRTDTPMPVERARELLADAERRLSPPVSPAASPAGTPAPGPHPPADGAR